uniref:GAF domain-containing protein n=1 Tax=Sphingomonas sp. GlSt437 TaxID=3389970 RepID=UPI003A8B04A4
MQPALNDRWGALARSLPQLMQAVSIDEAVEVVRSVGRAITGADGIAIVRRIGDRSAYVAEDSVAPLWAGRDFPLNECVAGTTILRNQPILVPDIERSDDVPLNLYLSTYVRRMAVYPFGLDEPVGAIAAYWRKSGPIEDETATLLGALAKAMGGVFQTLFILEEAKEQAARGKRRAVS